MNEILGARLATIHNLHYYLTLMAELRDAIAADGLAAYVDRFRADRASRARMTGCPSPATTRLLQLRGRVASLPRTAPLPTRATASRRPPPRAHAQPEDSVVLISPAYAQAAGAASQTDTLLTFLPMVAIFVVFYFLLIRPQQKKAKEARAMLEALEKGDEVVTAGGIVGRIAKLDEQYVTRRDRAERRDGRAARRPSRSCCPRARSRRCSHRPDRMP